KTIITYSGRVAKYGQILIIITHTCEKMIYPKNAIMSGLGAEKSLSRKRSGPQFGYDRYDLFYGVINTGNIMML
ncbi:MAG: hypothetical protein H6Q93_1062, partial [Nitrospirae bacterium]|nr:hypothetical protein [Nitrospirota bacterium]